MWWENSIIAYFQHRPLSQHSAFSFCRCLGEFLMNVFHHIARDFLCSFSAPLTLRPFANETRYLYFGLTQIMADKMSTWISSECWHYYLCVLIRQSASNEFCVSNGLSGPNALNRFWTYKFLSAMFSTIFFFFFGLKTFCWYFWLTLNTEIKLFAWCRDFWYSIYILIGRRSIITCNKSILHISLSWLSQHLQIWQNGSNNNRRSKTFK